MSFVRIHTSILTNFPQLKGNISAMCEISKKSIKHVTSNEKSAQNTYEKRKISFSVSHVSLCWDSIWMDICCNNYLPSILIVQSMVVKKVQLVLFQRSIRMPGSKLMRSSNFIKNYVSHEQEKHVFFSVKLTTNKIRTIPVGVLR
jgi:hypothetical protein